MHNLASKFWTWQKSSVFVSVVFVVLLWNCYRWQAGWQRWLFFVAALMSMVDVFSNADRKWLRR